MYNLSSLKAVILGLSFKDMRDFTFSIVSALEVSDRKGEDKGDEMYMMLAVTEWAENYEGEQGQTPDITPDIMPDIQEPQKPATPETQKEVHLDIPKKTDFMILTAKVPNDLAEDFQKLLMDSKAIMYTCDFVDKREVMNDKYWTLYGRNCWEQFFT